MLLMSFSSAGTSTPRHSSYGNPEPSLDMTGARSPFSTASGMTSRMTAFCGRSGWDRDLGHCRSSEGGDPGLGRLAAPGSGSIRIGGRCSDRRQIAPLVRRWRIGVIGFSGRFLAAAALAYREWRYRNCRMAASCATAGERATAAPIGQQGSNSAPLPRRYRFPTKCVMHHGCSPPDFDARHGLADRLLLGLEAGREHIKATEDDRASANAKYEQ